MRPSQFTPLLILALTACGSEPLPPGLSLSPEAPTTTDDLVLALDESTENNEKRTISYQIAWTVDGEAMPALDDATTVPAAQTAKGQVWRADVTPIDDKEHIGIAVSAEVTVINTAPTASVELAPQAPLTTQDLVATVTSEDVDGDTLTTTYTWLRDGMSDDVLGDTVPSDRTAKGELWTVRVIVNDGETDSAVAEDEVSIDNTVPVADLVTLTPANAFEDTELVATPAGDDADGDTLNWTYSWYINDVLSPRTTGPTLLGVDFNKGDSVRVDATPNDGLVDGNTVGSDAIVIQNTPPSLESAFIDPSTATETETLSCNGTGWADIDFDAAQYRFSWEVNGTVVSSADTLNGADFNRDDAVVCIITPWDGEAEGASVRSDALTVDNTAPVIASVALSSTAPKTNDVLTATASGTSDVDADTVSFSWAWTVDGATVATTKTSAPTTTLDGGVYFDKGDEIQVTVTPYDDTLSGLAVSSAKATVANTAPVIAGFSIGPSPLYTTSTATASRAWSDADGDTVRETFAWTVDGSSAGGAGASLAASAFSKKEVVASTLTISDGTDTDVASASSLTVANTPPTAPGVAITPAKPDDTDDLICTVTTASSDADSDKLTYEIDWYLDGSLWTGRTSTTTWTGDTIDAAELTAGDEWECEVAADDGDDTGASTTSTTVTVASSALTPVVGATGTLGTFASGTDNDQWKICRVSGGTAWFSADSRGGYDFHDICKAYGFTGADAWGGTCGDVCGFCGTPGSEYYSTTGAAGKVVGNHSANKIHITVHWRCAN